jgi:O-antigen ligase
LSGSSDRPGFFLSAFAVLLGLSVIISFLSFLREPPLGDFHGEWSALVLFSFASLALLPALPRRFPVSASVVLVPLTLALLLLVHFFLGIYDYPEIPITWLGYLSLAVLAILLGQGIRAAGLLEEVVGRLAWALVITGSLNAASQVIQAIGIYEAFSPFVVPLYDGLNCRVYGNVAQANQATTLAWLGLGAVLYLQGEGRLSSRWAIPVIVLLLIGSALTASRMAWLFMGFTVGLMIVLRAWPAQDRRARWLIGAMLAGGFASAVLGSGPIIAGIGSDCVSGVVRLGNVEGPGILMRLEFWRQAIDVWMTSPWIGVGAYKFAPTVYMTATFDVHRPLDAYVHNSALQILAEFGLIGAGALAGVIVFWGISLIRCRRELRSADAVLILWLGVLAIHAMLEFVLWYMHFLLIFSLALGLLVRPEWSQHSHAARWRPVLFCLAMALVGGAFAVFYDYRNLDRLHYLEDFRGAMRAAPTEEVQRVFAEADRDVRFFRLRADHLMQAGVAMTQEDLDQKIAVADRLIATQMPQGITITRRIALAVLADDLDAARWHLTRLFAMSPTSAEVYADILRSFLQNRPDEFAALGPIIDEELARRPKPRW